MSFLTRANAPRGTIFIRIAVGPRQSPWVGAFLDSVNVGAVALMAGVTFRLGAQALRAWQSWVISITSLIVLLRWKVAPAWVVLGGGIAGLLLATVRG